MASDWQNIVKDSKINWKWLFAWQQYEQWDIVDKNRFKRIYQSILKDLDDHTRKRIYAEWNDLRRPQWDMIYVNHSKDYNCDVYFDRNYIYLVANQQINKNDEIFIFYWENNIDF